MIRDSIRAASVRPVPVSTTPATVPQEITGRLEEIERAMLALANENRSLKAEVSTLRERVASLDPAEGFARFYASFFERTPARLETCRDRYMYPQLLITGSEQL